MSKLLWLIVSLSGLSLAQLPVSISGVITDQTDAVIPAAQITLRHAGTKSVMRTMAGKEGAFQIPNVPTGAIELSVRHPGFAAFKRTLEVTSNGVAALRIVLSANVPSEQVEVSATAELLQVSRATQSASITARELQSLLTSSRLYTHLIAGEPGVAAALPDGTGRGIKIGTSPGSQADDGSQSINPSVNGARPTSNAVAVNGIDTTNMMNGGGSLGNNITVPLTSIEAIEVQTALYTANGGRNGGANIQMTTRGGTNDFHGSAAHFLQNESFNANDFFLNKAGSGRPRFRHQESYAGLGGRIIRDKTFFHISVQRQDFQTGYAARATAQTAIAELLGDIRNRDTMAAAANQWLRAG